MDNGAERSCASVDFSCGQVYNIAKRRVSWNVRYAINLKPQLLKGSSSIKVDIGLA